MTSVMVRARVGKEFPDARQNVRKIEFIKEKGRCKNSEPTSWQPGKVDDEHGLLVCFYSQGTKGLVSHLPIG